CCGRQQERDERGGRQDEGGKRSTHEVSFRCACRRPQGGAAWPPGGHPSTRRFRSAFRRGASSSSERNRASSRSFTISGRCSIRSSSSYAAKRIAYWPCFSPNS